MLDPIVFRELPVIQKIIADETWLEGERRGCWVSADDPVVRENVCLVVLRIGAALRTALQGEPAARAKLATMASLPADHHPHAA
jgi:hypothetical protein